MTYRTNNGRGENKDRALECFLRFSLARSLVRLLRSKIYSAALSYVALNLWLLTKSGEEKKKRTKTKKKIAAHFCEYAMPMVAFWRKCHFSVMLISNNFKLNLHYANLLVFDSDIFAFFLLLSTRCRFKIVTHDFSNNYNAFHPTIIRLRIMRFEFFFWIAWQPPSFWYHVNGMILELVPQWIIIVEDC